jgi:exodeoxyribonuclease V gamma subunit
VPVEVTLPDGTRVTGTVLDRLNGRVRGPARVGFQVARPAHRLAAWLDLMVLVAAHPGADWRSIAVHRGERTTDPPDPVVLEPRGARPDERHHRALAALGVAVDLLRRAQREPLPLFAHLSHAVATGDVKRQEWPGKDGGDDANLVVYGECSLEGLLALPARGGGADPPGPGGRVRRLAAYLWDAVARSVDDADPDGVR